MAYTALVLALVPLRHSDILLEVPFTQNSLAPTITKFQTDLQWYPGNHKSPILLTKD